MNGTMLLLLQLICTRNYWRRQLQCLISRIIHPKDVRRFSEDIFQYPKQLHASNKAGMRNKLIRASRKKFYCQCALSTRDRYLRRISASNVKARKLQTEQLILVSAPFSKTKHTLLLGVFSASLLNLHDLSMEGRFRIVGSRTWSVRVIFYGMNVGANNQARCPFLFLASTHAQ